MKNLLRRAWCLLFGHVKPDGLYIAIRAIQEARPPHDVSFATAQASCVMCGKMIDMEKLAKCKSRDEWSQENRP